MTISGQTRLSKKEYFTPGKTILMDIVFRPRINRLFICGLFLLISVLADAQREKIKTFYTNRQLRSKGSTFTYPTFYDDKRIPKKLRTFSEITKKVKEWKYWYQNGILSKIEHYKLIINKDPKDLPHGKWIYFNDIGLKYREDTYNLGTLVNTTKEIFHNSQLAGKISIQKGISYTIIYLSLTKGKNLILNPDFDFFYYKPVPVQYHGQNKIEDWIPSWVTPGNYTPDYISNLRFIDVLSYSYLFDMPLPDTYHYAGIALYQEFDDYSEYIQGEFITPLIEGKKYCLRTSLTLCSYSKYTADRLAFYFSSTPVHVDSKNESTFLPQVTFSDLPTENSQFTTMCDFFTAAGGEKSITIGRFSSPDNLSITKRENIPQSLFGLEKAAYYLIDNVELLEIEDSLECICKRESLPGNTVSNKSKEIFETDLNKLKQGIPVVLENVNFEFNSFKLLESADNILNTLYKYLNDNPDLIISIEGHTDDVGTEEYNLELSINRARSVYNWLINKGIDAKRLRFSGFGKSRPFYNHPDEKYRALNRRVEIRIIKD